MIYTIITTAALCQFTTVRGAQRPGMVRNLSSPSPLGEAGQFPDVPGPQLELQTIPDKPSLKDSAGSQDSVQSGASQASAGSEQGTQDIMFLDEKKKLSCWGSLKQKWAAFTKNHPSVQAFGPGLLFFAGIFPLYTWYNATNQEQYAGKPKPEVSSISDTFSENPGTFLWSLTTMGAGSCLAWSTVKRMYQEHFGRPMFGSKTESQEKPDIEEGEKTENAAGKKKKSCCSLQGVGLSLLLVGTAFLTGLALFKNTGPTKMVHNGMALLFFGTMATGMTLMNVDFARSQFKGENTGEDATPWYIWGPKYILNIPALIFLFPTGHKVSRIMWKPNGNCTPVGEGDEHSQGYDVKCKSLTGYEEDVARCVSTTGDESGNAHCKNSMLSVYNDMEEGDVAKLKDLEEVCVNTTVGDTQCKFEEHENVWPGDEVEIDREYWWNIAEVISVYSVIIFVMLMTYNFWPEKLKKCCRRN